MEEALALVDITDDLSFNGSKVVCGVTGHEMPLNADVVKQFLSGKRRTVALRWREAGRLEANTVDPTFDVEAEFPNMFFMPHKGDERAVFCSLTQTTLKRSKAAVTQHMEAKRYQHALKQARKQQEAEREAAEKRQQSIQARRDRLAAAKGKGRAVEGAAAEEQAASPSKKSTKKPRAVNASLMEEEFDADAFAGMLAQEQGSGEEASDIEEEPVERPAKRAARGGASSVEGKQSSSAANMQSAGASPSKPLQSSTSLSAAPAAPASPAKKAASGSKSTSAYSQKKAPSAAKSSSSTKKVAASSVKNGAGSASKAQKAASSGKQR